MIELKTPDEIDAMAEAGAVVARALAAAREHAAIGVSLKELDQVAAEVITSSGATSPFLNYHPSWAPTPFPGVICASVNDAIVHGVPGDYRLADGDLVSIDCGAKLNGWCGDSAISFTVGTAREADVKLSRDTRAAMAAGIAAARPGNRIGDIGAAIAAIGRGNGYGMTEGWGGHGVGHDMHEPPHVPNENRTGYGPRLKPGLVIAIEPMFTAGGDDGFATDPDGWTLRTTDGTRAAHWEHTIAITPEGPRLLTVDIAAGDDPFDLSTV
ncbi:type I methionyl aminopeptidase [Stackebrandtia nassauensis]|uniref:Methionine aminopeptidase n=1 Tax=Stackebrandtia nassauensis (strain DSM 44728 / CIP 108903 / NRRL B-16338 / NBRC 102104 / LLR-40K-21) TaxID=446470 RepID=D3PW82_STANL|nr:type I methionyl aminopeptidase [Stackebrandtia nassauensis]ADD41239.1 methionine aminopeptidase, type I [Stackebrandtia nassauensis DSM 44728]